MYAGQDPVNMTDGSGLYWGEDFVDGAGDVASDAAGFVSGTASGLGSRALAVGQAALGFGVAYMIGSRTVAITAACAYAARGPHAAACLPFFALGYTLTVSTAAWGVDGAERAITGD